MSALAGLLKTLLGALTEGGGSVLIALPITATVTEVFCEYFHPNRSLTISSPLKVNYHVVIAEDMTASSILNTLTFAGFGQASYFGFIYCRIPSHYTSLATIIAASRIAMATYTSVSTADPVVSGKAHHYYKNILTALVQWYYSYDLSAISHTDLLNLYSFYALRVWSSLQLSSKQPKSISLPRYCPAKPDSVSYGPCCTGPD
ncbi:hypothetical protein M422DRAFT_66434 [Sphaerobolus stellatus SS14]|uniref:Uncharacterized protein n=1 Tax=Sphaerobolus stellatus (strain SS14) TaxID=990650 RepID=A0A0C9VVV6_SPHS4|nr:hypothetical protein M422DRAFT_66434 [Sphaerobolus stellatus SS14]